MPQKGISVIYYSSKKPVAELDKKTEYLIHEGSFTIAYVISEYLAPGQQYDASYLYDQLYSDHFIGCGIGWGLSDRDAAIQFLNSVYQSVLKKATDTSAMHKLNLLEAYYMFLAAKLFNDKPEGTKHPQYHELLQNRLLMVEGILKDKYGKDAMAAMFTALGVVNIYDMFAPESGPSIATFFFPFREYSILDGGFTGGIALLMHDGIGKAMGYGREACEDMFEELALPLPYGYRHDLID